LTHGQWLTGSAVLNRLVPATLIALAAVLLAAATVWAHSSLERSDPPEGGIAGVGRTTISLWFAGDIDDASVFSLRQLNGTSIPTTASISHADRSAYVVVESAPLETGTHFLEWSVISFDGHRAQGTLTFGVGLRPVQTSSAATSQPVIDAIIRAVDLTAMLVLIGAFAVSSRALSRAGVLGSQFLRRARLMGAIAGVVAIASGGLIAVTAAPAASRDIADILSAALRVLTQTDWGAIWITRAIALLVAALLMAAWALRLRNDRPMAIAIGSALLVVTACEALAGHATSLEGGIGIVTVASGAHLLSAGVWMGGLAVMAVCLAPSMRRDRSSRDALISSAWRAFSPIAGAAVVVVAATGLYEAGRYVPDLGGLLTTLYGNGVLLKVLILGMAMGFAALNTLIVDAGPAALIRRILRRPARWVIVSRDKFVLLVAGELLVAVAIVSVASILISVPTALETELAASFVTPTRSAMADDIFVTVENAPISDSESRLVIRARSLVKPDPGPITAIELTLTSSAAQGPITAQANSVEPTRYEAQVTRLRPGDWTVALTIHRQDFHDSTMSVEWTIPTPPGSEASALQTVTSAAAVIMIGSLIVVLLIIGRRRESPPAVLAAAIPGKVDLRP
jgi:putative copper export protein/methionine-rich copper-binding protein CopC